MSEDNRKTWLFLAAVSLPGLILGLVLGWVFCVEHYNDRIKLANEVLARHGPMYLKPPGSLLKKAALGAVRGLVNP